MPQFRSTARMGIGGPTGLSLSDHDPIVIVLAHRRGATQPRPPSTPPRPCPPLAGCSAIYESPDISINPSTSNDIGWTVGLGGVGVSQRGKLRRRWKRSRPLAPSVESWHRLDLALRVPTAPNHSFDVEQCRMDGRSWWSGRIATRTFATLMETVPPACSVDASFTAASGRIVVGRRHRVCD